MTIFEFYQTLHASTVIYTGLIEHIRLLQLETHKIEISGPIWFMIGPQKVGFMTISEFYQILHASTVIYTGLIEHIRLLQLESLKIEISGPIYTAGLML